MYNKLSISFIYVTPLNYYVSSGPTFLLMHYISTTINSRKRFKSATKNSTHAQFLTLKVDFPTTNQRTRTPTSHQQPPDWPCRLTRVQFSLPDLAYRVFDSNQTLRSLSCHTSCLWKIRSSAATFFTVNKSNNGTNPLRNGSAPKPNNSTGNLCASWQVIGIIVLANIVTGRMTRENIKVKLLG